MPLIQSVIIENAVEFGTKYQKSFFACSTKCNAYGLAIYVEDVETKTSKTKTNKQKKQTNKKTHKVEINSFLQPYAVVG